MLFCFVWENDFDDIVCFVVWVGVGMIFLLYDVGCLVVRIWCSIEIFVGELLCSQQGFLFVLEDIVLVWVVGVSVIEVVVGLDELFYNFCIQKMVCVLKVLGVYKFQELFNFSYDYIGYSELCMLFFDLVYQCNCNGLLFFKVCFLFIVVFCEWFFLYLFVELCGCSDEQGQLLFWDVLGYYFFDILFVDVDWLIGIGMKIFIVELMLVYLIYILLLLEVVCGVIGQVYFNIVLVWVIFEKEGFSWCGLVDIFDVGLVLEVDIDQICVVCDSQCLFVWQLMGDLLVLIFVVNG